MIFNIKEHKFYIRKETTDKKMLEEIFNRKCYDKKKINFHIEPEDVWLDCGANIGGFTIKAGKICKRVYSFECENENYQILQNNIKFNNLKNISTSPFAVSYTGSEDKIYLCNGQYNKYEHTLFKVRGRKNIQNIKSAKFSDVLLENPDITAIKFDIEGSEIEIIENVSDWGNVKKMVIEYSFNRDRKINRYNKIVKKLKKEFPTFIVKNMNEGEVLYNHFPSGVFLFFKR